MINEVWTYEQCGQIFETREECESAAADWMSRFNVDSADIYSGQDVHDAESGPWTHRGELQRGAQS